jgi:alpha/beta superfamily hydrolase
MSSVTISSNSVLPARREGVTVTTADGLVLRGELAVPEWTDPIATVVCVHPLTTHGGSKDSHLFRKMAWRLPAQAGVAVLRINLRGAGDGPGRSDGAFDECRGEGLDLGAIMALVMALGLPDPWLVGWSFGTDVVLKFGDRDPVSGAILLSPPLRFATPQDLSHWADSGRPMLVLVPEFDDYVRPQEAERRFAAVPQAQIRAVAEAGHLWVGERFVRIVLNEIVRMVAPAAHPLPTEWSGPMERWSDL